MKIKEKCAVALARFSNKKISYFLYLFIFNLNKPVLILLGGRTWLRNSIVFKQVTLGLSDFDLTLFVDKSPDQQKLSDLKFILSILKVTMGRLGELVIYNSTDLKFFTKIGNPLELSRDPFFSNQTDASKSQKVCFLMRMLWSDRDKLLSFPSLRVRKWSYILELVNNKEFKVALNEINLLDEIKKTFEINSFDKQFSDQFFEIYSSENIKITEDDYHFHHKMIWNRSSKLNLKSNWEIELVVEQVKWEVWGLYTQRYLVEDIDSFQIHLTNLNYICDEYLSMHLEYSELKKTLGLLKRAF